MVKKTSAASGNGKRSRTSAAAVANDIDMGAAKGNPWGLKGIAGAGMEAGASADTGFTTDTASGRAENGKPDVGDVAEVDGVTSRWNGEGWEPYGGPDVQDAPIAEVVAPAKRTSRKPKQPAPAPAEEDEASEEEESQLSNMTSDLVHGVESLERLAEEVGALKDDAKEVMDDLKSKGYSPKVIRIALRRRQMDPDVRASEDSMLQSYEEALRGA